MMQRDQAMRAEALALRHDLARLEVVTDVMKRLLPEDDLSERPNGRTDADAR